MIKRQARPSQMQTRLAGGRQRSQLRGPASAVGLRSQPRNGFQVEQLGPEASDNGRHAAVLLDYRTPVDQQGL